MSEHDELPEDEVEAHGMKEAAAGLSAAAMLAAGAGAAKAATPASASANAKPAAHPAQKLQKKTEAMIKGGTKLQKKTEGAKADRASARVTPAATDKI
jgi:hypothetical protein